LHCLIIVEKPTIAPVITPIIPKKADIFLEIIN